MNEGLSPSAKKDINNNGTLIDEFVGKIFKDNIIDGNDAKDFSQLYNHFKNKEGRLHVLARARLHEVLIDRISKGFRISDAQDYKTFDTIIEMLSFGRMKKFLGKELATQGYPLVAYMNKQKNTVLFVKNRRKQVGVIDMNTYTYSSKDVQLRNKKSNVTENTISHKDKKKIDTVLKKPVFRDFREYLSSLLYDRKINGGDLGNIKLVLSTLSRKDVSISDRVFVQKVLQEAFLKTLKIGYGLEKGQNYKVDMQVLLIMLSITYKTNITNIDVGGTSKTGIENMLDIIKSNQRNVSRGIGLLLDFLNVEFPGLGAGINAIISNVTKNGLLVRLDGDKLIFSQKLTWKVGEFNLKTKKWIKKGGWLDMDLESMITTRGPGFEYDSSVGSGSMKGFRGIVGDTNDFSLSLDK